MNSSIRPAYSSPVLQYNRQNAEWIGKLCEPLQSSFGIDTFAYFKGLDRGRFLYISNDLNFLKVVTTNDFIFKTPHFKTSLLKFSKLSPTRAHWPDPSSDPAIEALRSHGGNYLGYNLIREREGSLEAAIFTYKHSDPSMVEFCEKHTNILDQFVSHFLNLGRGLCETSDLSKLGYSPNMDEHYSQIDSLFTEKTPWEHKIIQFNKSLRSAISDEVEAILLRHSLTPRELECLSHLSTGKTAKQIAHALEVTPKTIEVHLNNIRIKLGIHNRMELSDWFKETFKFLEH